MVFVPSISMQPSFKLQMAAQSDSIGRCYAHARMTFIVHKDLKDAMID